MLEKLLYVLQIATGAILQNKLRAFLTSLGIIFGVASVIAMLAIGRGAEQQILRQIKLLGANNVIVEPVVEQEEGKIGEEEVGDAQREKRSYSPGLTLADAQSIHEVVPGVEGVSPEVVVETKAVRAGQRRSTKLVGVSDTYFTGSNFELESGHLFSEAQLENAAPVAIIGNKVKARFFPHEEPIGRRIKCGRLWLTVVGVAEKRAISEQNRDALGLRNYDLDIYTPLNTMLLRYKNRAKMTGTDIERARNNDDQDEAALENYHQLDRLVVRVGNSDRMAMVADVVNRMLKRRHQGVVDYQVVVPEQLLEQERRTQRLFNIVLACIASISLVVGGIGIMNIMLASVMERIREIGVRRAVGATRRDVMLQFLIEATAISLTGGVIGIGLGILLSAVIESATGITTIVSVQAVLLSFAVSVGVGLVFGLLPARRATQQEPVEALRHE